MTKKSRSNAGVKCHNAIVLKGLEYIGTRVAEALTQLTPESARLARIQIRGIVALFDQVGNKGYLDLTAGNSREPR